ncbi:MAG: adenylate/guanylate cyclase domain-containing protein [Pirellulales bacterium]|nr:adenylate/guanylate cyclase domain-containing protein [Pirellulales bacterium]
MADLVAQGPELHQRWRRLLPLDASVVVGRQARGWSASWDDRISREHARLHWNGKQLSVERLASAANPVFFQGRAASQFQVLPGEHWVIGNTTFTLSCDRVYVTLDAPLPTREQTFSAAELGRIAFRNAQERLELLGRLPDLIQNAVTDNELFLRVVSLLLSGIPLADAAALVEIDSNGSAAPARILHWDRHRLAGIDFQPSQRLIQAAVGQGQTVLHTWHGSSPAEEFTGIESIDWSFCTPLPGKACAGWALYVAGRFGSSTPGSGGYSDPSDLRDDIKFTELAAATLSSLRELRRFGRQQAGLSQFFSPLVLEALSADDPETILSPQEAEVTVLFCDLRGFSKTSEQSAGDLFGLLNRVSKALGVMTHQILDHAGVVGDFQGDAAMGFWGWPLAVDDGPQRAALAALGIRAQFGVAATQAEHPLFGFQVGIGIATGRAVAGKIGTADHVKVTVFGPVANLAARLESMTRTFHAPILIDGKTAEAVRRHLATDVARCRKVAVVRPYGFESAVAVNELLPPEQEYPLLSDQHIRDYECALEAFSAGNWPGAFELLHKVPADDRVKDFLTVFIAGRHRTPPPGWDGVISLDAK